jgi:hypothetical protein
MPLLRVILSEASGASEVEGRSGRGVLSERSESKGAESKDGMASSTRAAAACGQRARMVIVRDLPAESHRNSAAIRAEAVA